DVAGLADDRRDVDDAAGATLDHVLDGGLRQVERAGQVDRDDLLPVVVGHLGHGPVDGDAGVVHQDVQPAVLLDDVADHATAVFAAADVPVVQGDPATGIGGRHLGEELLGRFGVAPVAGRDFRAVGGEVVADGGADAAGAAGDQGNPVL